MSVKNFKFVSPGVFINEIDNSFRAPEPEIIGPVVIGRAQKGLAMTPIKVENYRDFVDMFGDTVPGKGGGDVYRYGNNQSPMYATYAAKAFLKSEVAPLTFVRLLGQQDSSATATGYCGWQTNGSPGETAEDGYLGGGAYGLFVAKSASLTQDNVANVAHTGTFALGAIFYTDKGAMLLSGTVLGAGTFDSSDGNTYPTASLGAYMNSDSNGNFKLRYSYNEGDADNAVTDNYSISFNDDSQNFIRKRINTNPTLLKSGTFYPLASQKDYWLGESFEQFVRDTVGVPNVPLVGIMLPLGTGSATNPTQGPSRMKNVSGGSQEAKAGWFISQDVGPSNEYLPQSQQKLFRLKGRGHGEWLHKNAKVQVDRVRGPASLGEEYGSFSVIIRALHDTDQNPVILERYDNLDLDPTSPDFISKRIGDVYYKWDETNSRLRKYGSYENQSKYVYVELNDNVAAGATNPAFVPFGYFGPPKFPDVVLTSSAGATAATNDAIGQLSTGPLITAKASSVVGGITSLTVANAISGGYHRHGGMRATLKFPQVSLVGSDTDAMVTRRTDVSFGMRTSRAASSTRAAIGLGDVHRLWWNGQADDPTAGGTGKSTPEVAATAGAGSIGVSDGTRTLAAAIAAAAANFGEQASLTITSTDGTARTYTVVNKGGGASSIATGTEMATGADTGGLALPASLDGAIAVALDLTGTDNENTYLVQLKAAINSAAGHGDKITVGTVPSAGAGAQTVSLTQAVDGHAGNTSIPAGAAVGAGITMNAVTAVPFTGGESGLLHTNMLDAFSYVFSMDDIVNGATAATYTSGSRRSGTSYTAQSGKDYRSLLDLGYDSFTAPFFGGFDGFDITKPDPLANLLITSDAKSTNYIYNTYRQALEMVADPELLDFNLLAVPGLTKESLTNYQMELCEERRDALALIDLPSTYTPFSEQDSVTVTESERSNRDVKGIVNSLEQRRIDTSYACTYYPWVQTRDSNNGQILWVPPSVAIMGVLANTQKVADVWYAPAGFNRGSLTKGAAGIPILNAATRLSSKERDTLYDAHINPIASFPDTGVTVFGQRTLQMLPSALDRINVRRLVLFLKKRISILSTQVLFEQNVQATWDRFKGLIEPLLANVKSRYGLTEYKLVLDETTTTPDLIDQNILYAKIMIKPARAIEFIAIDFIIANTGASFDD
jgi:hypothetical protein